MPPQLPPWACLDVVGFATGVGEGDGCAAGEFQARARLRRQRGDRGRWSGCVTPNQVLQQRAVLLHLCPHPGDHPGPLGLTYLLVLLFDPLPERGVRQEDLTLLLGKGRVGINQNSPLSITNVCGETS